MSPAIGDALADRDPVATEVVPVERLPVDRGVAAIVENEYVAVFRLADGEIVAVDHVDPFTGAPVLARGLVALVEGCPAVASPLHKQRFDLRTGQCLDDPDVAITVWSTRVIAGTVWVSRPPVGSRGRDTLSK